MVSVTIIGHSDDLLGTLTMFDAMITLVNGPVNARIITMVSDHIIDQCQVNLTMVNVRWSMMVNSHAHSHAVTIYTLCV